MRIALLTYSTKPRGGVIHAMELAEALHHLGQQVCLFALSKDNSQFCRPLTCDTQLVPAQSAPDTTDRLIQQRIKEYVDYFHQHPEQYDIYHAQDCLSANALVMLRAQGYPIPHLVRTVHHIEDFTSPYLRDCQKKSILQADRCFCISRYWQQELKRLYDIEAALVFNGVNSDRFSAQPDGSEAALKQRLGITGTPVFLTVGGVEPRKNSIRLLQAFAQVREQLPQAQLVIAGGMTMFDYSDYRDQFFAEATRLGIAEGKSLVLTGMIADQDMPTLYRCADTFVFPSLKEGWGLVVMEAMASGLPVVTGDRPPFTEFLSTEQALLVDVEDPRAIAVALQKSLDLNNRNALVNESQSVLSNYTWENSARMHLKQYSHKPLVKPEACD